MQNTILIIIFTVFLMVGGLYLGYLNVKKDIKIDYERMTRQKYFDLIEKSVSFMDGYMFEVFTAYIFRENGFNVVQTKASRDGGKDLILNGNTYVELKKYTNSPVGRETVQKLMGACVSDNIRHAIFITTSHYTKDTINYFNKRDNCVVDLELWYLDDLLEMCDNLDYASVLEFLGYDYGVVKFITKI